jgi:hypothetical protein
MHTCITELSVPKHFWEDLFVYSQSCVAQLSSDRKLGGISMSKAGFSLLLGFVYSWAYLLKVSSDRKLLGGIDNVYSKS